MGRPRASFMAIRARLPASSGTISSASPLPYGLELPQHSLRALDGFLSLSDTFRLFGANAAWLRLAVISHNVMTALSGATGGFVDDAAQELRIGRAPDGGRLVQMVPFWQSIQPRCGSGEP